MTASPPRVPRKTLFGVFLIGFAILSLEVGLTRVFSVVLDHHYAFLAVSIAICGLGMGGLILHVLRRGGQRGENAAIASAAGFAVATLFVMAALLYALFTFFLAYYWLAGILLLVPFAFAGAYLADVFERHAHRAGRVYAADLIGSGLAAVFITALLRWVGGVNACLLAAVLAAWAAVISEGAPRARVAAGSLAILVTLLGIANVPFGFLAVGSVIAPPGSPAAQVAKPLFVDLSGPVAERPVIVQKKWNAFARTDLVENPGFGMFRGDIYQVFTNGHVPTYMMRVNADLRERDLTVETPLVPAWWHMARNSMLAFRQGPFERVLCIGPGGGSDVILALSQGAKHVEGAELNGSIIELMHEYAAFNGYLYQRDDVSVVMAEGRSYVRQASGTYDMIYAALTQTATAGGATALLENYIYTREAFQDYWGHLSESGMAAMIVHDQALALRLMSTAIDLLRSEGMSDFEATEHLAMFAVPDSPYAFLLLLSKQPFVGERVERLVRDANELEVRAVYVPRLLDGMLTKVRGGGQSYDDLVAQAAVVDPETGEQQPLDIRPVPDDRPFFFDVFHEPPTDVVMLGIAAAAMVLLFSVLAAFARGEGHAPAGDVWPFALYFTGLGAGFMLIEIPLIQKLVLVLGYPTVALTTTLFGLLLGGGIGSALSQRLASPESAARLVVIAGVGAIVYAVTFALLLPSIDAWLLPREMTFRIGALMAILGGLGILLGMLFPSGIRMLARFAPLDVPWMWGLNGILSVVGSLLAVLLANAIGFRGVLLVGAGVYAATLLLVPAMARRSSRAA